MKYRIEEGRYTVLKPEELWQFYSGNVGLYRGGGNTREPKLVRANGPRASDIVIVYDAEQEIDMVIPDPTRGISFSSNIQKLSKNPIISGQVWLLPKGESLPEGLVFNVKVKDHPLLNVNRRMSLAEFIEKVMVLSSKMRNTGVRIEKGTGRIIEEYPGALKKAEAI